MSGMFFVVAMTEKNHIGGGYQCFYSSPDVFIPAKTPPLDVYFWQTENIQLGRIIHHSPLMDNRSTEDLHAVIKLRLSNTCVKNPQQKEIHHDLMHYKLITKMNANER
jgi:hypothetical protein